MCQRTTIQYRNAVRRDVQKEFKNYFYPKISYGLVNVILLPTVIYMLLSQSQFSRNSQMLRSIMCRCLIPNFTRIVQDTWESASTNCAGRKLKHISLSAEFREI